MSSLSLRDVHQAQEILDEAEVISIITGDIGLSYHGVDIVTHDVELCIPSAKRGRGIKAIESQSTLYERLQDLADPDFYHPYKKGAARFRIVGLYPPVELYLVTDTALGQTLSHDNVERGLTNATAHQELEDLCEGVSDTTLASIGWPTLSSFTNGWLSLAAQVHGGESEIIYLMQAERLIDANAVDNAWCDANFTNVCCKFAKDLLGGKKARREQSTWD